MNELFTSNNELNVDAVTLNFREDRLRNGKSIKNYTYHLIFFISIDYSFFYKHLAASK